MKQVSVQFRTHHGLNVAFPLCEAGKLYATIAGTSHLTKPTIDAMKRLGVVFNVVQEQRSV